MYLDLFCPFSEILSIYSLHSGYLDPSSSIGVDAMIGPCILGVLIPNLLEDGLLSHSGIKVTKMLSSVSPIAVFGSNGVQVLLAGNQVTLFNATETSITGLFNCFPVTLLPLSNHCCSYKSR